MPFVGALLAVADDHVIISSNDPGRPDRIVRGTRESRPVVNAEKAPGSASFPDRGKSRQ